jgi:hypothetical protein
MSTCIIVRKSFHEGLKDFEKKLREKCGKPDTGMK